MTPDEKTARAPVKQVKSLRNKFVRTLLLVTGLIGLSTLVIVVVMSAQASSEHLAAVQKYIEEGITSKGRILTQNHAVALRSLTLDNSFLDMQRLVERAIKDDSDLVYGLYVNSEKETLALALRRARPGERSPEKDSWRELDLAERDLLVKELKVTRRQRLGDDLLEVAAPVIGEDGELLGTVRYGLSTHRMHDAITKAELDAKRRLERSALLLGSLISFTILLGLILSRMQAVRITRPIDELTQAAEELAAGDRGVRVKIQSADELALLGASFNKMVEELDSSYRVLEEMNRTLEHKVAERTDELAEKNRDMRLVLDNVDQGFVTLSVDGRFTGEPSRAVALWFGAIQHSATFWEYLERSSGQFAVGFELAWAQLSEGFLPTEVCLAQLPERLSIGERTWSFRYLPFHRNQELEGVLVVIADISERLLREREDAEHMELMQAFKRLMQDRAGFEVFLRESGQLLDTIWERRLDSDTLQLKRALHTLKGNAASMGLSVITQLCHTLEDELAESGELAKGTLEALSSRWTAICDHLVSSGNLTGARAIEVPEEEFSEVVQKLERGGNAQFELLQQVLSWRAEPVEKPFRRLADQARALARRLGKGEVEIEIAAGGIRLDSDVWSPLFSELIHLVRNAVDHGLETPDAREEHGKRRQSTLSFRARNSGGQLAFEIGDDGAGIDWSAIARRAQSQGLPHSTEAELFDALCADGVSTRAVVTSTSGRGVGMGALRERIRVMHGRLEVKTALGVGTTWLITFPLAHVSGMPSLPARAPSLRPGRANDGLRLEGSR